MFTHIFVSLLVLKIGLCQINGEFWWLHEKVAQLQHLEPPKPKFEDISEHETDESVKVVFKDNELYSNERNSDMENKDKVTEKNTVLPFIVFLNDRTKLVYPEDNFLNSKNITVYEGNTKKFTDKFLNNKRTTSSALPNENNTNTDEFEFVFPENNDSLWENKKKNYTNSKTSNASNLAIENNKTSKPRTLILNDKIWFEEEKGHMEVESICTFLTSHECVLRKGFIHMPGLCPKNIMFETRKVCCVLPLKSGSQNPQLLYKRYKRSDSGDLNAALKQRNALLFRKYNSYAQQVKIATSTARTKPVQKIVSPGDYVDPYWNIKDAKFRKSNQQSNDNEHYTKYDGNPDYDDDYGVELPKPGLVGLYSDNEDRVTSWKLKTNKGFSYGGIDEVSEEDDTGGFGYSTIDPRLGKRKSTTASKPPRRHPQRLMKPQNDPMETLETQKVHFHSSPDFHILEGFKLVNLAENKNRPIRKTTTDTFYPNEEEILIENTSPFLIDSDFDYDDDAIDTNQQVFKNCGKSKIKSVSDAGLGKTSTETRNEPWLALVVLTKDPQNVLCYATIVHPRAAVTAASCVEGKATGVISAISGVWDLKDRTKSQQRMASIHIHPEFNGEDLSNDLAILYWKRPLRLQPNVLPACLTDPHVGDECYFVGWGGFDQALQQRSKWQHATILTPRSCKEKMSSPDVDLPSNAFCASVDTRGTVTGVGGPLLCKDGDSVSIVGVAIYREDIVILLPVFEWVASVLRELQIIDT